ncbi:MAG: prolyl oligopeptidase family serine peptidase, partial [bacterium]
YSVRRKPEKNETGVMRLRGLADRRSYERTVSSIYIASEPEGMTRRVTAGEHSTYIYDVHPDGKSLLVGRTREDLSERPYSRTELIRVNLADQGTDVLYEGRWIARAIWSPDGMKILVTAGPTEFGGVGVNVPEGTIPNDYDTQAFLFDPVAKTAEPLTKTFAPSITAAYWPETGGDIYFVAEDGEYVRLYRYDLGKKSFKPIDLGCDVIDRGDVARDTPIGAFTGSGATHPERLYTVELSKGKSQEALDPKAERFRNVRLGRVEDWDFESIRGSTIVGRIHYPPDFSPDRKWPCIVYYYGGTSPVDRSFGGRYPKNLWAAFGYVVYVLQPSGATGFGQAFSARHVNDWGKTVAGEIIEGTETFLAAHDFVDPDRVGCIGASFGGFMTELLVTETDMFAAAVSHAGISSISSYWGEGYWGYEYNAVSAANSFPWNRPDIYIEQSPLFAADKINTPLLLLHGTSDTNVPTGESEQMYAALKLLGKEVEYIRVEGQNHLILDYKKRMTWSDAILAWFDRWLKDEPEWWNDMYPPLDENGGNAGEK